MNPWIEAMRLRTLPVSVAGVAAGTGCAIFRHGYSVLPMLICLLFAVVAQIASNFANEYYDFKNGLDKKGREGFRRGVTEGDISPRAMKRATFLLLILDSLLGCSLIFYGGWWLTAVGVAVALFALAYSTGPYPLSHHGLGDVAVVIFFGFVPVIFTEYVQTGFWHLDYVNLSVSLAIGLMAANVLIVNNYRDRDDDAAVGKRTTVVIFGRRAMAMVYLLNGLIATLLLAIATTNAPIWTTAGWFGCVFCDFVLWQEMRDHHGAALNKILKYTSLLLFGAALYLLLVMTLFPA